MKDMDNRKMDNQDSEPLFGDDVYNLLRDDSLLQRTGSTNFAALISANESIVPESVLDEQQQQQQIHQQQQQNHMEQQLHQPSEFKQEPQQEPVDQGLMDNHPEGSHHCQQRDVKQEVGHQNQQGQQIVYQIENYPHSLAGARKIILVSSAAVGEQPLQQQEVQQEVEQQPALQQPAQGIAWDDIDMENEDSVQDDNANLITTNSFMTLIEESSSLLPDTTNAARIVPSLQPWAGKYNFSISLPTGNRDRNKWCYSEEIKKLYVCPNVAIPINIMMSKWIDASITITPVFQQSQYRMDPINRCYNCKSINNCEPQIAEHIVQVEGEGCSYEVVQERHIVKVPVQAPPPGEAMSTLLVKLMCLTSCVGGPNRRPFCLVLTLRSNVTGAEIGRQILDVKCCKCPSRDLKNDTKGASNSAAEGEDGQHTKIRRLSSQLHVGQKRKKPKVKPEPGTGTRYVNVAVPVEFELQVKSYVNGLIAEQILRQNQPNLLLYPEDDNNEAQ